MRLIVGLGNPGPQYHYNRHNVGFLALDLIQDIYNFPDFANKDGMLISEGTIDHQKVRLLKPLGFMNRSGPPVAQHAHFFKVPLDHILVIHDDLDLAFGKIKVKTGGGSGGHNGIKSLDAHLGKDYMRLRIGIDHPGHKDMVSSYVLGNFPKDQLENLPYILTATADHLPFLIQGLTDRYQTAVAEQIHTSGI